MYYVYIRPVVCFLIRISVGQPFHISDRFVSNVLPRLEAAIGIGIKSALGKVYAEVVVKSGVKLVEGLDKRGHKKFLPDPQVYPEEYVVEVFSQWAFGHSNRLPIWKELLDVLQEVGLQDMSQQVEAFVKGKDRTVVLVIVSG